MSLLHAAIFHHKAKLHAAQPLFETISCSAGQSPALIVQEKYE